MAARDRIRLTGLLRRGAPAIGALSMRVRRRARPPAWARTIGAIGYVAPRAVRRACVLDIGWRRRLPDRAERRTGRGARAAALRGPAGHAPAPLGLLCGVRL